MMKYAGGPELTEFLLAMSGLGPCRLLELGAEEASSVLLEAGYFAQGVDAVLAPEFEDGAFEAVLSQGVLYGSGQEKAAWQEALRLLKQGGLFLLADACFSDVKGHVAVLQEAGFEVLHVEDATALWAEYGQMEILEQLGGRGRCRYFLSICRKP